MTDGEISAGICSVVGFPADLIPNDMEIAIYRAGMRRAARVARHTAGEFFAASNVERSIGADIAAAAIEREAAE